jgi:hypothetical protein
MPRRRKLVRSQKKTDDAAPAEPTIENLTIDLGNEAPKLPKGVEPAQLAVRGLMRRAEESRTDPAKFYGFVIRHETTKKTLTPAPHQLVMFDFVGEHDMCIIRLPIGCGKTFGMTALALWHLGQDQTQRGAIISKTQGQAAKPLHMVSDYIIEPDLAAALTLVFPWLQRSTRPNDTWTQTAITIDRPPGIRDPSLIAAGMDGSIGGSRLSYLVGDDILDADNTLTEQARDKTHQHFESRVLSRMDPQGSRVAVCNTPWHLDDMTYRLEAAGWPSLTMDIYGNVQLKNVDDAWVKQCAHLRPSTKIVDTYRLVLHDPDPDESTPLWPERYTAQRIAELRSKMLPHEFARLFLCKPFDETKARCQREWIEACKDRGRGQTLVSSYHGSNPVYTGVDLGVGQGKRHDKSCIFTFEKLPDNSRRLLSIVSGRWSGPEIADRLIDTHDSYQSIIAVESNAAQDFVRQFAQAKRPDLRVRAHTTQKVTKHNIDFGIESIFTELKLAQWIIPCDRSGNCHAEVQGWIDECLYYQPPPAHTGDRLMACWIARETARRGGGGRDPRPLSGLRLSMASGGGF